MNKENLEKVEETLTPFEEKILSEALEEIARGEVYTHEEVWSDFQQNGFL